MASKASGKFIFIEKRNEYQRQYEYKVKALGT